MKYDAVESALERVGAATDDAQILEILDETAEDFVHSDLNHRLVPFATRLNTIDYAGHPYAALPAGVAICVRDRTRGRAVLRAARLEFDASSDRRGLGLSCFVEGLEDLGEGRLDTAASWWSQSLELLGEASPVSSLSLAHLALTEYQRGDLDRASRLAQQALFASEQRNDARGEAIASVYLAFFQCWTGDFDRAELAVARAESALARIEDPSNRYEAPLASTIRAVLANLRGESEEAEALYAAALEQADLMDNEWYRAIALASRALDTAPAQPIRAVRDAQQALTYLDRINERWWSTWAANSLAVAHLRSRDHHAGLVACSQLMAADDLNHLERGRVLCTAAELHEMAGDLDAANGAITAALDLLSATGARYWIARAEIVAASIDRNRTEYHLRSARRRAGTASGHPGWTTLLRGRGTISVRLLGTVSVEIDSRPVHFSTTAEMEVLAMLAIAGATGRSALDIADEIWPDTTWQRATHRLDNLMSSLRRTLLPTARLRRTRSAFSVELDTDECDYTTMTARASALIRQPALTEEDRAKGIAVLEALRQPLLGGPIAPWVVHQQTTVDRIGNQLHDRLTKGVFNRR